MKKLLLSLLLTLTLMPAPARAMPTTGDSDQDALSALVTAAMLIDLSLGTVSTVVNGVSIVRRQRGGLFWPIAGIVSGVALGGAMTAAAIDQGVFGYPYPQGMVTALVFAGAGMGALVQQPRAAVAVAPVFQRSSHSTTVGLALAGRF